MLNATLTNSGDGTLTLRLISAPSGTRSVTYRNTLAAHPTVASGGFTNASYVLSGEKVNTATTMQIIAWDGLNGTGNSLASTSLTATATINPPSVTVLTSDYYSGASWTDVFDNNFQYNIGNFHVYYSLDGVNYTLYGTFGRGSGAIAANSEPVGYNTNVWWQVRVDVSSNPYGESFTVTGTGQSTTGSPPAAPPAAPGDPSGLTAVDNGANIQLNWIGSGATGYEVSRGDGTILANTSLTTFQDNSPPARPATYRVRAYNTAVGTTSSYSNYITVSTAKSVPTSITPVNGTTLNTDVPTLQMTFAAGEQQKAEWQFATDVGFTTNVKDFVESDYFLRTGPFTTTQVLPNNSHLAAGIWYFRGRSVGWGGSTPSAWTPTNTLTVSHPPTSFNLTPSGGGYQTYNGSVNLGWTFASTSPISYQTAYQVVVERASDGFVIYDSGKVTSGVGSVNVAIPATYKDIDLRWKIQLWDNDNVTGGYSSYQVFRLGDAPTVTVTAPANDSTIFDVTNPQVTWTFATAGGRTQASYRVQYADTVSGIVLHDSGVITGTATSYTPPTGFLSQDNTNVQATVTATDTGGLSSSSTSTFTFRVTPPVSPGITLDLSMYATSGYAKLSWDSRDKDPAFYSWRIYRRLSEDTAWTLIDELMSTQYDMVYTDYLAAANEEQDWAVVQVVTKFGSLVEGNYNFRTGTPIDDHYWIVVDNLSTQNFKLSQVTDDSYTEEYEEAEVHLLGRGRHMEFGDRLGYKGSMTAKLRDQPTLTAREQRKRLLAVKANQTSFYLRNPFGDVWLIAASSITVARIAGVGGAEFVDVTIPYAEVAP